MKIVWIMPSKRVGGGVKVIFEYGNRLTELGHEVIHVAPFEQFPYPQNWLKWIELKLREYIYYKLKLGKNKPQVSKVEWFPLKAKFIEVPDLSVKNIPDADVVIATAWDTVEWVNTYPASKGTKFYFVQHYETWAGPKKQVDHTYKLPFKKITIASWLTKLMEEDFGEKVYATINNGINLQQFYNNNKRYNTPRRIGMLYHGADWKGVKDGIKAFSIARKIYPDIQLVMFGVKKEEQKVPIPDFAEFYQNPPQEKIREIYSSIDIFVSPSWTEGFGLPAMEAMACKCAVASTDTGGINDFSIPDKTVLISPPKNPEALAKNIITLLESEKKLKELSEAGFEHVKEFSWDKAAKRFEETLINNYDK
jgi:glycosyltransferase involved in cell wall biosynthesis